VVGYLFCDVVSLGAIIVEIATPEDLAQDGVVPERMNVSIVASPTAIREELYTRLLHTKSAVSVLLDQIQTNHSPFGLDVPSTQVESHTCQEPLLFIWQLARSADPRISSLSSASFHGRTRR
jgi:hypothetical protein